MFGHSWYTVPLELTVAGEASIDLYDTITAITTTANKEKIKLFTHYLTGIEQRAIFEAAADAVKRFPKPNQISIIWAHLPEADKETVGKFQSIIQKGNYRGRLALVGCYAGHYNRVIGQANRLPYYSSATEDTSGLEACIDLTKTLRGLKPLAAQLRKQYGEVEIHLYIGPELDEDPKYTKIIQKEKPWTPYTRYTIIANWLGPGHYGLFWPVNDGPIKPPPGAKQK